LIESSGKRNLYLPNKCIQTINAAKSARIAEGENILNSVFATEEAFA